MKHVEEAVAIRDRLLDGVRPGVRAPAGTGTVAAADGDLRGRRVLGRRRIRRAALARDRAAEVVPRAAVLRARPSTWWRRAAASCPRSPTSRDAGSCARSRSAGRTSTSTASCVSAEGGHVVLSTGEEFDSHPIVWTAGNARQPGRREAHRPAGRRARLGDRPRRPARRTPTTSRSPDAWAAGDDAAVPDLASPVAGRAHRAERAARGAAGQAAREEHRGDAARRAARRTTCTTASVSSRRSASAGASSSTGASSITGFLAWVMHRGYHVLAIPTWERKVRVLLVWAERRAVRARHRLAAVGAASAATPSSAAVLPRLDAPRAGGRLMPVDRRPASSSFTDRASRLVSRHRSGPDGSRALARGAQARGGFRCTGRTCSASSRSPASSCSSSPGLFLMFFYAPSSTPVIYRGRVRAARRRRRCPRPCGRPWRSRSRCRAAC